MANFFSDILIDVNNDVIIDAGEVAGNALIATSVVDLTTEPATNDVVLYCDIPSNAKIKSLIFFNDDLDSTNTVSVDIGIYAGERIVRTDGTVFDENDVIDTETFSNDENFFFQANIGEDMRYITNGNAFVNLGGYANSQLALWELAGIANLPEDPFKSLRIGAKIVGPFGTFVPGKTMLQVTYVGKT